MNQSVIGTITPEGVWEGGSPPNVSTLFLPGQGMNKKVASIWLKIAELVAYVQVFIATGGFRTPQNSYGFRAI